MRMITLTIAVLVLLASGCTSPAPKKARRDGIVSAMESRHCNAVDIALWTLGNNGFDVPEIEFEGPYAEAEPKLKKLVDQLAKLPSTRLRELDESYRYHRIIYSPRLWSGGVGWKDYPTSEVITTHDRSPHVEAVALVMETQADVIKTVDTENWWHDTKTREWTAQRPFAPGTLDSTHLFQVEYKIEGIVVAKWWVDTERRSVQRETASNPGTQPPYVRCVGRFTDYEEDYRRLRTWVKKNGTLVHDDGICPRATFRVSAPAIYAGCTVGVLYKHEGNDGPTPPALSQKGKDFSFELPEDFLAGRSITIDSTEVRNVTVIP